MITWLNNNLGFCFSILAILLISISVIYIIEKYRKSKTKNIYLFIFPFLGIIIGALIAIAQPFISNLDTIQRYLIKGGSIGLGISIFITIILPILGQYKCDEIQITFPQFSQLRFVVNNDSRRVAWSLFIETITRIATQPLQPGNGYIREALNSLHSLFQTTRDLLKSMEPSKKTGEFTVEMFATSMLNDALRPFLSKWHPLLKEYEIHHPNEPETEWEYADECRKDLEKTRLIILDYAKGFGELAKVANLDHFLKEPSDSKPS